jgi:two-component system sensor histidine kinase KdpD
MLSSVSHDLKTPLASIIGALEIFERMKTKLSEEKQTALIAVALQEAYRLDTFITNILDMARIENCMVKAKRENAEIGDILQNCFMRLDNRLRSTVVHYQPLTKLEVEIDAVLLSRAICLVLDNAVKYGGNPSEIYIDYGINDNMGFIGVRDNGCGIPDAHMESIFSKYTRYTKEDQQNAGTGLGLSISRAIMKLLEGSITVKNHASGGAHFTLQFPLR